ncbi:sensor histidine kinase [uncultured Anaerotruncus sp.]|uniref:cache domain-containing sensor histidine kinase n=1 Tax=uncultured Anaerotruncus sp. TaxID=905011 RepID=UPI00280B10FE|nr:sensor histidine kinase [uncultured Anaerotruncus sp.]
MRKLWELFQNNRFRNKMAITYVFMALIPLVIFAAVSAGVFLSQARRTTMSHTAQITGQVSNSIDMYISTIDKMADYLTCMLQRSGMLEDAAAWERMQTPVSSTLSDIARSHPEIAGILIATEQDDSVSTGMSRISRDPFTSENWYRLATTEPDRVVLVGSTTGRNIVTKQDYSADNVFSLAKAVKDRRTGQVRGVILFDVSHEIITDSIKNVTIGEKGFVFVVDSDDNMVFTPVNEIVYRVDPAWLDGDAGVPVTAQIAGGRYQIRYEQSDFTGWKTVGVFSLDEVMGGINTIVYVLILCIVGTGALVLFVSLQLANSVTKPISKLQKLMKQAESGDLSVRFNSLYSDEIGDLGHSFNHMIHRIDHLIHQVYEEQQSKRDAELKSLQEQIKPHFLYNTLDTISWMARDYGADDIVKLVDALTSMFRIGLSHGKDFISLQEETTHVSNYLYIQKIRYKDKLSYAVDVPAELSGCLVPKLILQPLVENAIYHGIKQKRGGGTITVSGRLSGEELRITVRDDGAGMPPERLAALREQLDKPPDEMEKTSFGLFYIAERIRLCYGDRYGISLESTPGEGTTVTVALPARAELINREVFHV